MRRFYVWCADLLMKLSDLPQLFFRLILAYGFFHPAVEKAQNFQATADWFASMNYPAPTLSLIAALTAEWAGVILLPLGLLTRVVSVPLMVVMGVAITTVHWDNGFKASNNGFEIPLYYFLMLFSLFIIGPGRISIDGLLARDIRAAKRAKRQQASQQRAHEHRAARSEPSVSVHEHGGESSSLQESHSDKGE